MALAAPALHAAGFQHGFAADPDGAPLEIGIWYPSRAAPQPLSFGPTTMTVALNGPVDGRALPLVVISHGTGGSFLGHYDTAIALADAGYVVAAVTHRGDNYADQSRNVFIMDRPSHMRRLIDHMLAEWNSRASIDTARIGMFGFSAGGFTTLVSIGGRADFSTLAPTCREHPGDFPCQMIAGAGQSTQAMLATQPGKATLSAPGPARDERIRAAVVVAPALGFAFAPDGLKNVSIPVQLWRAEDDRILPQPRYAEAVRLALPNTPDYHVVPGAGHFDFLAPCSAALADTVPAICQSAPGFDRAAFHQGFNTAVVAFFDSYLKNVE
jgi:predicted dienelactone hydrolase